MPRPCAVQTAPAGAPEAPEELSYVSEESQFLLSLHFFLSFGIFVPHRSDALIFNSC